MNSVLRVWFMLEIILGTCFAQVEWSIRLRDGISPLEGRVEIFIEESWRVVMDNNWSLQDAHVVCRQLGFSQAKTAITNLSASPSQQAYITSVQCQGQEPSLAQCSFTKLSQNHTNYQEIAAAGVVCAVEFSIRLVGVTTSQNHGYLEILDQTEQWRRVCLNNWSQSDALVACRQLGYHQLLSSSNDTISSSNDVAILSTNCTGEEFHLQSCSLFQLQLSTCNSEQSVILECVGAPTIPHSPRVYSTSCSSLTLTWTAPNNKGSSITCYWVRYKQSTSDVWNEVKVSSMSNNTLQTTTLENLLPITLYNIQISAANEIGNSSFSDISYAWTTSPDLQPPTLLEPQHIMSTSALFLWNISSHCGARVTGYEIVYHQLNSPDTKKVLSLPITSLNQTQALLTIDKLRPYSEYRVQVRAVSYVGESQQFVSNFSQVQLFMTSEGVPSSSPQSITGYLSPRQNLANFRWSAVNMRDANGLLIGYNLSCNYTSDGHVKVINKNFDNSTFQSNLTESDIVEGADYECVIAASTRTGKGPSSAPVYFTIPDLNRPRPPFNVVYAIIDTVDSDRETFLVQAMWSINDCQMNFSCFEIGYIIQCRNDDDEIRMIVWQNELEIDQNSSFGVTTFSAKPFRTYQCAMAAINAFGAGFYGSAIDVKTPQLSPRQSPTHLYASIIQPNSVTINWRYNENPPVGKLVGFYISYYLQDERYPNQNGEPIVDEDQLYSVDNPNQMDFSYVIDEHLSPGVSYNVYIAAVYGTDHAEGGGTGPQASMSVTTLRTAPPNVPSLLQNKRDTLKEPFQFTFIWEYSINQRADALLLGGFILHCYRNISNSTTDELFSYVYFVDRDVSLEEQYSISLKQHVTCASQIASYMCDVRAFNEMGEGLRSTPTTVYLPCNAENGSLQDSFLADPYVGVVLLVLVLLLIAVVSVLGIMLCYYVRQNYLNQRIIAGKFDSYSAADTYDEGYINMAPSGATVKPFARNGNLPLPPGVHLPTLGESTDDSYNHYDWIPANRNSKGDNVYDEINLRGARMLSAARGRQGLNTATQNNLEMSTVHNDEQLSEIEESQVTTMSLLVSQGPDSVSVDPNELKLNELQRAFSISPTQSTDYIEMSGATGKKMGKAERNLHDRSATSLSNHSSVGGTPKRAKYNPYSYDTSTGHQLDQGKDPTNEFEATSTAAIIKPAQESTFSRRSSSSGVQKRLSTTSNNSTGVGCSSTTYEQFSNGQDEVDKEQTVGSATSGQKSLYQ